MSVYLPEDLLASELACNVVVVLDMDTSLFGSNWNVVGVLLDEDSVVQAEKHEDISGTEH